MLSISLLLARVCSSQLSIILLVNSNACWTTRSISNISTPLPMALLVWILVFFDLTKIPFWYSFTLAVHTSVSHQFRHLRPLENLKFLECRYIHSSRSNSNL
ncbi:hypothetical protein CPB83DRAFT_559138 [Crepidotus variabilis]|uniref:Uncharacterized protein n=1 Tax=Crepidotus variabilis TaxID=179855 RepID=A0A9P6JLY1_9AGAR|nr:hypothetical protein CPB83DRAFT_559138 [Crepidotus variabilis]